MSSFEERRRQRASWPVRVVRLGEEELVDSRDASTIDERMALVWKLTRELWAFRGEPMPEYTRAQMPGRVVRPK
ncbi:MAG: hypothetical protein IT378_13160 [Sandaracinaceae bacterium]|nr:hypothetical protein [Sandaracinaceae bacterium]